MKTTSSQFKCDLCGSIASGIPYCGGCETALPNSTKIGEIITVKQIGKPAKVKRKAVAVVDEDDDLYCDYENKKAALIFSLIYSRKKKK